MARKAKKSETYNAFEDLTKKLLAVQKKELDKKVRLYESKKAVKSKKKD